MEKKFRSFVFIRLAQLFLAVYRRNARVRPLTAEHVESVTLLLTEQFCLREPLCKNLDLKVDQLLPFFRLQVRRAADLGLGLVAETPKGELKGAVIMEDHGDLFLPSEHDLSPALQAIGALLDQLVLPPELDSSVPGETIYCALVALKPGRPRAPLLTMLTVAVGSFMLSKGYKNGYAKVTNPLVIANFRKIERFLRWQIFTVSHEIKEDDVPAGQFAPLTGYHVSLVHWRLGFWC